MVKNIHQTFIAVFCLCANAVYGSSSVPESWKSEWNAPSAAMRPLQMIHHYGAPEKMLYFKEQCGLGGIVCNVGPKDYLYNDEEWERFVSFVKSALQHGLRVWIYDEDGYPSPHAGGVVLRGHPELESLAMVYDAKQKDKPFYTRPAYEFTHASNNYAASRRYPNPLHPDMTPRFLQVTHEQYRDRLGSELFAQIEAFFTDEPSLNAINLGLIPEEARKTVRVDDPLDPSVKPLPMVPWCDDMPQQYQKKYGEDLMPRLSALFFGDSEQDKDIRQKFWSLTGELNRDRFYGKIQEWCRENGSSVPTPQNPNVPLRIASSGHTLREETTPCHVPLDGNKLEALMKMDVPGLDMLDSKPQKVAGEGWRAAIFPVSAAYWTKRRLVMTEVCDHFQREQGEGDVDLKTMCATAAWQAAMGVTEFLLYYQVDVRGEEIHKKYCEYVGRLNAVLRNATIVPEATLYYPVRELQAEYTPQADPLDLGKMSPEMKRLVGVFEGAGAFLVRNQIPFVISGKRLTTAETSGMPFLENRDDAIKFVSGNVPKIIPKNEWIIVGRFKRDGHDIFVLLNTDDQPYQGELKLPAAKSSRKWSCMNPADGSITEITSSKAGNTETIRFRLEPKQTMIFVGGLQ